jgi:hypothetical protein
VISWHSTGTGGYTARVTADGFCVVRLHARANAWRIEHLDGEKIGPAASVGHAKRAALQALAELLPKLQVEVEIALRAT